MKRNFCGFTGSKGVNFYMYRTNSNDITFCLCERSGMIVNSITMCRVVHSAWFLVRCEAHYILFDQEATEFNGTGLSISKCLTTVILQLLIHLIENFVFDCALPLFVFWDLATMVEWRNIQEIKTVSYPSSWAKFQKSFDSTTMILWRN